MDGGWRGGGGSWGRGGGGLRRLTLTRTGLKTGHYMLNELGARGR